MNWTSVGAIMLFVVGGIEIGRSLEYHLTKKAAASWFQRHDGEVWNTRKGCDLP